MTLILRMDNMNQFYEMTDFARKPYYNELDFECSSLALSLVVSRPTPQGRCFIDLQLQARFFSLYSISSDRILRRAISTQQFFITFLQMKRSGFDYIIFTLSHLLNVLKLSFCNITDPNDPLDLPYHLQFPLLPTSQYLDLNRDHSSAFVVFPPITLQTMLATFNDCHVTLFVTLTTSEAKFTGKDKERNVEFVLFTEKRQCVIRDLGEGEVAQFAIVLDPIESFKNILSKSDSTNLVGIGKSKINTDRGVITMQVGSYAQYVSYSSDH